MAGATPVSDFLSNAPEQIERLAMAIGTGERRKVFDAIYHHKSPIKTVEQIAKKTGLSRMRVLQHGRALYGKQAVKQTKRDGDTAYEMIESVQWHKKEILGLIGNKKKLAAYVTKRKPAVSIKLPKTIAVPAKAVKVKQIYIDDIDSFSKVKRSRNPGTLSDTFSEDDFKEGVRLILGEMTKSKDWGGETSDLYTSRLRIGGKRVAAAFAFKGPGLKTKLVPGKMGKNGDQAMRLFQEEADVFVVQHWRDIAPSVVTTVRNFAVTKSIATGKLIKFCIIDGQDSERIRAAYPNKFVATGKKKKKNAKTKTRKMARR